MNAEKLEALKQSVRAKFIAAGANATIDTMAELPALIDSIEK